MATPSNRATGPMERTDRVLLDVLHERARQDAKWGEQNHADGTGALWRDVADRARERCEIAFREGRGTYRHILSEEVAEAFAEADPAKLRAELVQVAAVAVAWVEALDRRAASGEGLRSWLGEGV